MSFRTLLSVGGLLLLVAAVGCSSSVKRPNWFNPGPAGYQQYQATQGTDPYPLPDVGPPVVGARPRGFQNPVPEVERSRQYRDGARVSALPRPVALPPVNAQMAPSYYAPATPTPGYVAPAYTAPPVYSQPY